MRRRITVQLGATLGLLAVLVIAGLVVMTVAVRELQSADRQRAKSTDALLAANRLEQSVLDLETGLRGYLLTGQSRFLQPYEQALTRYRGLIVRLQRTTSGSSQEHAVSTVIGPAIASYVNGWAERLIAVASRHLGAARAAEAGGGGKQRVDAIRRQFGTLIATETRLRNRQVRRASDLANVAIIVGFIAIAVFVVLVAIFAVRAQRRVVAPLRRLASAARRISAGDLAARVPGGGTGEVGELVEGFNRMAASLEHEHNELERTAQSLATLLESTDEGIYGVDLEGKVTLVNRAALEQTGFAREELMGSASHELLHHTRADGSAYPAAECPVAVAMRTGEALRVTDELFWRRDATSFPVEYSASPLREGEEIVGAVISFRDVTMRVHLQRVRDAQHALSRALAEASSLEGVRPQMMGSVATALGFDFGVTWEPAADGQLRRVAMFAGAGFEEIAARLGPDRLAPAGTLAGRAIISRDPVFEADLEHNPPRSEGPEPGLRAGAATPVFGSDGKLLSVGEMFATRAVPEEGMLDALRSISALAAQYIERQRERAETQRLKDQFVATVSHELRTPLTAIDGWVHILLGGEPGPLTDEQRRFLEIINRNSGRLMRLVGDLLLANQIDAGRFDLEMSEVDVAALVRETVDLMQASAENKHVVVSIDTDAPVLITGDRTRLGQLLGNLVSNAIKYTPNGGNVNVSVEHDDGICRITVADTGIGIPAADREHLFERFFRASSATQHGVGGTGLGLAISKAIAEGHHGTIELASREGPGSVFVVELPLSIREEAPT